MSNYEDLELEDLREECNRREIPFVSKDGRRNLCSKLRVFDSAAEAETDPGGEEENPFESSPFKVSGNPYALQIQLLELQRQMGRDQSEARMREKRLEIELEKERRVTQLSVAREEEERHMREEDRVRKLRQEKEESEMRLMERQERVHEKTFQGVDRGKSTSFKMREMRPNEDVDDYFRVFEMTAKAHLVPKEEWLGNLVPKLSEKAKEVYLELSGEEALDYDKAKASIVQSYQLTIQHYRYRFRNCQKRPDEDFVQWARRTRRFLDRWMAVAKATDNPEAILEQITMECLLDNVNDDLHQWITECKPDNSLELATLANDYVQARRGPLVDGKYVNTNWNATH